MTQQRQRRDFRFKLALKNANRMSHAFVSGVRLAFKPIPGNT